LPTSSIARGLLSYEKEIVRRQSNLKQLPELLGKPSVWFTLMIEKAISMNSSAPRKNGSHFPARTCVGRLVRYGEHAVANDMASSMSKGGIVLRFRMVNGSLISVQTSQLPLRMRTS
jgi:hypothetical protein